MADLIDFGDYSGILFSPIKPLPNLAITDIRGLPTLREYIPAFHKEASDVGKMNMFINLSNGLFSALSELRWMILKYNSNSGTMHGPGIVHRDIRPENIIIGDGHTPILIDFGLAVKINEIEKDVWGSKSYAPPEIYYRLGDYDSDCWHVGLILYEFLSGEHLIDNSPDVNERRKKIVEKVKSLDNGVDIINFYEELIEKFSKLEKHYLNAEREKVGMGKIGKFFNKIPTTFSKFQKYLALTAFLCEPLDILKQYYGHNCPFGSKSTSTYSIADSTDKKCSVVEQLEEHVDMVKDLYDLVKDS